MDLADKPIGSSNTQTATFAGGCFWCTQALFERLRGVEKVVSGYSGGDMDSPTYEDVSSGTTRHAEAIQILFDQSKISYKDLLYVFFRTHDPTTKDRQGADVGSQYRSVIFYHNDVQKNQAEEAKRKAQKEYKDSIVTEIVPFKSFTKAEDYHQDYYTNNPNQGYCKIVIDPKIKKLEEKFGGYLKR